MTKTFRSDNLIRELYIENAQLMKALKITEERQKAAEEAHRKLQLANISSSS